MTRVVVTLASEEREALVRLAVAELRYPTDQARFLLREGLERRGLLRTDGQRRNTPDTAEREVAR